MLGFLLSPSHLPNFSNQSTGIQYMKNNSRERIANNNKQCCTRWYRRKKKETGKQKYAHPGGGGALWTWNKGETILRNPWQCYIGQAYSDFMLFHVYFRWNFMLQVLMEYYRLDTESGGGIAMPDVQPTAFPPQKKRDMVEDGFLLLFLCQSLSLLWLLLICKAPGMLE